MHFDDSANNRLVAGTIDNRALAQEQIAFARVLGAALAQHWKSQQRERCSASATKPDTAAVGNSSQPGRPTPST